MIAFSEKDEAARQPAWSTPGRRLLGSHPRRILNAICIVVLVVAVYFYQRPLDVDGVRHESQEEIEKAQSRLAAANRAEELDREFLTRLVSSSKHGDTHQALVGGEQTAVSNYTTTIVLGRLAKEPERVQWVYDKLLGIQDPQIYIVDDPNTSEFPHLDVNHGREAAVYMKYILTNWDDLPDITFFWHSDEMVWHNNLLMGWNSVETINRMDRENIMREGYVPSRCDHWPGCPEWIKFNPSKAENRLDPHKLEEMFTPQLFQRLFPGETDFPPYMAGTCCSQFAVTRDTIRSRSKETYQAIFDWILEYEWDDRSGMLFEYTWPFIFKRKGVMCPTMQSCYCKTYNFCIEDGADVETLERWNGLRTRREEVRWQVNFLEGALVRKQEDYRAAGLSEGQIKAVATKFRPEIEHLEEDLDRLVNITWNAREEIIKHWKLPAPPVGW